MKNVIVEIENVNDNCEIRKFSSGVSELWANNEKISYSFSKIGKFVYDKDVDDLISFVEIKLGRSLSLSDRLIGIININGELVSPLYSERYDEMYFQKNIDEVVDLVFHRLFIDNNLFNEKNKKAKSKMKVFAIYTQKNKLDK